MFYCCTSFIFCYYQRIIFFYCARSYDILPVKTRKSQLFICRLFRAPFSHLIARFFSNERFISCVQSDFNRGYSVQIICGSTKINSAWRAAESTRWMRPTIVPWHNKYALLQPFNIISFMTSISIWLSQFLLHG